MSEYKTAKRCFKRALLQRTENPDSGYPGIGIALNNLACAMQKTGKPERGYEYLRTACAIYENVEESHSDNYLVIRRNMGDILKSRFSVSI